MPLAIMSMGVLFNLLNGYMQRKMDFLSCSETMYQAGWFTFTVVYYRHTALFRRYAVELASIISSVIFAQTGRHPALSASKGNVPLCHFRNYFGEIAEWAGWAILTCSLSVWSSLWTIANLVPRANAIWCRYREEFWRRRRTETCFLLLVEGAFITTYVT